jgi:hypothetical protein
MAGVFALSLTGCVYYNGMWSAERLARDARRLEARGANAEARLNWGRAATKAESVLVHHPASRWADDALVLQGEGLARSGACAAAARPLARALREVDDADLRERAALAAARCALDRDAQGELAERLLEPVLSSPDARHRSQAAYLAGQVALLRADPATAADRFARSELPAAAPARIGALAAAGRGSEAVAAMDTVARRDDDETRWADALATVAATAGVETAADALDHLLARGRLRGGARARLLIADGDRLRRWRRFDRAAARYAVVLQIAPDSAEALVARVHALLGQVAQARDPADLDSAATRLAVLSSTAGDLRVDEVREVTRRLAAVRGEDSSEVTAFRAAELARDSLDAPALAATLFLRFAARSPGSLFAPKALIAAGQLQPERLDSVQALLASRYAESPYTLAFLGVASPAYEALEDSLAVTFGVARPSALAAVASVPLRFAPPRTGPRGPELDPAPVVAEARPARPQPPGERRPQPARRPGERPTDRPQDRPDVRS